MTVWCAVLDETASHPNLHTKRSSIQSDIYQMYWYNYFSRWWAHGCPKHAENRNKHTWKRIVRQVGYLQGSPLYVQECYVWSVISCHCSSATGTPNSVDCLLAVVAPGLFWGVEEGLMYMKIRVVHNILVRQPSETVQNINGYRKEMNSSTFSTSNCCITY
jgi:hypothetical protein